MMKVLSLFDGISCGMVTAEPSKTASAGSSRGSATNTRKAR